MLRQLSLIGLALLLVACSAPETATPAPTQQAILVSYPSVLQAWVEKLSACASANPLIAIYATQVSQTTTAVFSDEIVLVLGEPADIDSSSSLWQVGTENVIIIANSSNDQIQLSAVELEAIFSGQNPQWESGNPVQIWVLPDGDPVRNVFDQVVMQGQAVSSNAMLAPDPTAMLEAISQEAGAIGYLPESIFSTADPALAEKVKSLQLEASIERELTQPVIAVTHAEPESHTRELLDCLQSSHP
jgi:hypothetical protein